MLDFRPGDRVGFRGWGNNSTKIVRGPLTILKRPTNPHDQHMWNFVEDTVSTTQNDLFHWRPDLKVGDQVPPPPQPNWRLVKDVLASIPEAREGMEARKVWDVCVNLPILYGPGQKYFAAHFPKTVDPERRTSRVFVATQLQRKSG